MPSMVPLFIKRRPLSFMGVGLMLSLSLGCSESPQELYSNARQATEAKRFDEAIKLYSEMTKDPQATVEVQYQSRFGTSEVYLAQGALDAQAKVLEELVNNPAMKDYLDTLVIKLEENYLHRAEVLGLGDSTQLTALLQKAIKLNPNSSARRLLAEHYVARGVIELKEGRYDEAQGLFSKAKELKSSDVVLNKKIEQYGVEARFKRYRKNAARLVDAKQEELARRGLYNLTSQTFTLTVEVMVDGRAPSKNREAYMKGANELASTAMSAQIATLIKDVFAAPAEGPTHPELITQESWTLGDTSLAKRAKRIRRDKKRVYVTPFTYQAKLSLDQMLRLAFEASEATPPSGD